MSSSRLVNHARRNPPRSQLNIPKVDITALMPVTVEEAIAINARSSEPGDPGPSARPFRLSGPTFAAAVECLAEAAYYEAAVDGAAGERAVVQVVINRMRHPAFPAGICDVVFQGSDRATGCQFTFTCDGALTRRSTEPAMIQARKIATAALSGYVFSPVGLATHYHANTVVPYWASSLTKAGVVGSQLFYRWKGSWGSPRAFSQSYGGQELDVTSMIDRWRAKGLARSSLLANGTNPILTEDLIGQLPELPVGVSNMTAPVGKTHLSEDSGLRSDENKLRLIVDEASNKPELVTRLRTH